MAQGEEEERKMVAFEIYFEDKLTIFVQNLISLFQFQFWKYFKNILICHVLLMEHTNNLRSINKWRYTEAFFASESVSMSG